jgi:hypothetical protein
MALIGWKTMELRNKETEVSYTGKIGDFLSYAFNFQLERISWNLRKNSTAVTPQASECSRMGDELSDSDPVR